MTYLQSLQAQSFPHIPKNQLAPLTDSAKMDIYENPSEHYASINNYGIAGSYTRKGGYWELLTVVTNVTFRIPWLRVGQQRGDAWTKLLRLW